MGADRTDGQEPARDVLAAEKFALPAPDPVLRQRAVVLPEHPSGIAEPHDVLAAEEFAMPAVPTGTGHGGLVPVTASPRWTRPAVAAALLALLRLSRRRR